MYLKKDLAFYVTNFSLIKCLISLRFTRMFRYVALRNELFPILPVKIFVLNPSNLLKCRMPVIDTVESDRPAVCIGAWLIKGLNTALFAKEVPSLLRAIVVLTQHIFTFQLINYEVTTIILACACEQLIYCCWRLVIILGQRIYQFWVVSEAKIVLLNHKVVILLHCTYWTVAPINWNWTVWGHFYFKSNLFTMATTFKFCPTFFFLHVLYHFYLDFRLFLLSRMQTKWDSANIFSYLS